MTPKETIQAYYYSFTLTGDESIDAILVAVARAGAVYHHTADWCNSDSESGVSVAEEIQAAANRAQINIAKAIEAAVLEEREACAKVCDDKVWTESATFGFGAHTAAGLGAKDCAGLIRARTKPVGPRYLCSRIKDHPAEVPCPDCQNISSANAPLKGEQK